MVGVVGFLFSAFTRFVLVTQPTHFPTLFPARDDMVSCLPPDRSQTFTVPLSYYLSSLFQIYRRCVHKAISSAHSRDEEHTPAFPHFIKVYTSTLLHISQTPSPFCHPWCKDAPTMRVVSGRLPERAASPLPQGRHQINKMYRNPVIFHKSGSLAAKQGRKSTDLVPYLGLSALIQ